MGTFSLVRGYAFRATRLDGCGNPVLGERSTLATDGIITVGLTANQEQGEAIAVTNAAGRNCILDEPAPKFVNYSVEVAFCGVNPELIGLLTGQPVTYDENGDPVGFRVNSKVAVDKTGFAWEMWSGVPADECDESGESAYGYMLLPFVKGGTLGDFSVENGAINFTVTGARTRDGSGWGVGPYDVVRAGGVAAPLADPVTSGDHLITELTTVAPPSVEDTNAVPLGTLATGATAGTPGSATPANTYLPWDLAGLQASSITASPATAWTTGQYVVLGDGSTAHWDGAAWVAGVA